MAPIKSKKHVRSNKARAPEVSKEDLRNGSNTRQTRKPWVPSKATFHKYLLCRSHEVGESHTHGNLKTVMISPGSQYAHTLLFS